MTVSAGTPRQIFVTGGTGYIGRRVIPALLARGHRVRALVRPGSERRLPNDCEAVVGDALDGRSFADRVAPCDTFLQLVGTPHPSPSKAPEFERVDFVSVRESAVAAQTAGVSHFVYLSVAQPASVMRAYVDVRARGEALLRDTRIPATFLRPWYVLGPGHRWPYLLVPVYWLWRRRPSRRAAAERLGLITLAQMVGAIVRAVEQPPDESPRIWDVPALKREGRIAQ
jgi:uncharacterized protein YbjT (DUF2867 family)